MQMRALQAAVLLAGIAACAAGITSLEPSLFAPGGLNGTDVPMFILLTHDDGIDGEARRAMLEVTKGRETENGCPVTATMFALMDPDGWTVCEDIQKLYDHGYEIADHTIRHKKLPGMTKERLEKEILGARQKLADCGIPMKDVVGMRTPYLDTDVAVRQVLHENGFLYDSSIIEDWKYSVSKGWGNRLWPFDLGYGNPINCSLADLVQDTTQICEEDENFPGLFEVPVWRLANTSAEFGHQPYAMDYGYMYECECMADSTPVFDILKNHLDLAYAGNRAPMPVFIHIYWLQDEGVGGKNIDQLQQFVDYALTLPDTYFVTMRQLLAWMQNPVPASELTPEMLGCGNQGGRPGTLAEEQEELDGGEEEEEESDTRRRLLRRLLRA